MKTITSDINLINTWARSMGGVFSLGDLRNLLNENGDIQLYRRINALIESAVLLRFKREFYMIPDCTTEILSQRIYSDSYISLGSALAKHLMIGSIPSKTLYSVKRGRNRTFTADFGSLVFVGTNPDQLFGFEYHDAIRYATPEKAFLDTLYYHQKGQQFSFDIYTDINVSALNTGTIETWLKKYNNPKFVTFVKGVISGYNQ